MKSEAGPRSCHAVAALPFRFALGCLLLLFETSAFLDGQDDVWPILLETPQVKTLDERRQRQLPGLLQTLRAQWRYAPAL